METKGKWSKLSIIGIIMLVLSVILGFFTLMSFLFLVFSIALFLASIVLSIISLADIKRYNLKGKWLAISTLILAGIIIILLFLILIGAMFFSTVTTA